MDGIVNHFRAKYAPDCRILHIQSQIFFTGGPAEVTPLLAPRQQFPVGSPAFPLFQIYETTTDAKSDEFETGFGLSNGIRPWLQIGSGADSIGHGGTCPSVLQMAGHGGGTVSRRTENKKLTKLH